MIPRQWILGAVGAMTVLTVIGCYSHYPSSVYGPGGYPGFYSTPPGGQIPQGGTIISPGLPQQGSGATLSPGANSYESQSPTNSGDARRGTARSRFQAISSSVSTPLPPGLIAHSSAPDPIGT